MQFLADMGVSIKVVEWLRASGHDAIHFRDEGLQRLPNGEIFRMAAAEARTVLAFDLDFGEIVASTRASEPSVIVFRLHDTRSAHVIQRLSTVLAVSITVLSRGVVIVVEEGRHRIRRLPIGG